MTQQALMMTDCKEFFEWVRTHMGEKRREK